MRRLLMRLALASAVVLALLWLAPALAVHSLLPRVATAFGAEISLRGVRPVWPLGITARRADVTYRGHAVRLEELLVAWSPRSYAIRARIRGGRVDAQLTHSRQAALVFLDNVPLEAFQLPGRAGQLALTGRVSGVVRWRGAVEASLRVSDGSLVPSPEFGVALPVQRFELFGWRDAQGAVRLDAVALDSPLLVARGSGDVSEGGELRLDVVVSQIEEPLRSMLSGGLPIPPGPLRFRLGGTLRKPQLLLAQSRPTP